jgi:DNA-directed RNA polymerase subunit E'/Rpb7
MAAQPTQRDVQADQDIYINLVIKERVSLPAKLQNRNMRDSIATLLRGKVEGRCTRYGYVRPTSVEVLSISDGVIDTSMMNGTCIFEVTFRADICNPPIGSHVRCRVENVNNYGLLAVNMSEFRVLEVIVPKDIADASGVDISQIQPGAVIVVSVEKRRYDLHQPTITIIGRVIEYDASKDIAPMFLADMATEEEADYADGVESISSEMDGGSEPDEQPDLEADIEADIEAVVNEAIIDEDDEDNDQEDDDQEEEGSDEEADESSDDG